jgi:hypothetical protein
MRTKNQFTATMILRANESFRVAKKEVVLKRLPDTAAKTIRGTKLTSGEINRGYGEALRHLKSAA